MAFLVYFSRPVSPNLLTHVHHIKPLALHAVLTGRADLVPPYIGSLGYLHGTFNGAGRT